MIDEQSSASGHDYASDRSAIGAGMNYEWTGESHEGIIITLHYARIFLQANENNFDDILAHIEDARKHPPGRHWVNNLLMPTLPAHQFLLAERERERERETDSSNSCALNVCYYASSVRVTSSRTKIRTSAARSMHSKLSVFHCDCYMQNLIKGPRF